MVSGYVINLPHRTDRLAAFIANAQKLGSDVVIEPFAAVNGATLVLDDALRHRVNPWNFEHLNERRLRGMLGCALSHLTLWERIATTKDEMVFIFEDDARLIDPDSAHLIMTALSKIPPDADLIWLNDYDRLQQSHLSSRLKRRVLGQIDKLLNAILGTGLGTACFSDRINRLLVRFSLVLGQVNFQRWQPHAEKTTEAYLISPSFAQKLHKHIGNDLGAIDEHLRGYVAQYGGNVYKLNPPLFTQANRADTDIQK
jgi:GR25 family glycosyltransferase involved in LPS biosynthesis